MEQFFVLREHLGLEWRNELLFFPVEPSVMAIDPAGLELVGPAGPVPFQLCRAKGEATKRTTITEPDRSELGRKPVGVHALARPVPTSTGETPGAGSRPTDRGNCQLGSAGASPSIGLPGAVAFVTDLPARGVRSFVLRPRKAGAAPTPAAALRVTRGTGFAEIATAAFAVRFVTGSATFTELQPAEAVPGPVAHMALADGTRFGGSRMYGPARIRRWAGDMTVAGPVFAECAWVYEYESGLVLQLTARLAAGDSVVHWSMAVAGDDLTSGWELLLTPGVAGLCLDRIPWEHGSNTWGMPQYGTIDVELERQPPGLITNLIPWRDWWDDRTQTDWRIKTVERGPVLKAASRDAAAWVAPAPPGTLCTWEGWRRKMLALWRAADGALGLRASTAAGRREWEFGSAAPGLGHRLNEVKDFVLAWPAASDLHPRMYLSRAALEQRWRDCPADPARVAALVEGAREEVENGPHVCDADALGAYLLTGSAEIARETKVVERLRHHLGLLGKLDLMRFVPHVIALYDALVDSPLVTADERPLLRARMAYLGYVLADPASWSVERGYRSYNLNMSVSYLLHLGMVACALPEHPLARTWAQPALRMTEDMLAAVGPAGEWPESVSNYTSVSASALLDFAIHAREAGFHDYVSDPRMKRLFLFMARQYAPHGASPVPAGEPEWRSLPPHGRSTAGHHFATAGMMAAATALSDPEYSMVQQWAWRQIGCCREIPNAALGGFEQVYLDERLPAALPHWGSDLFPQAGVIFQHGLGTPDETYLNLITADFNHQVFPSETGAVSLLCALGAPLAGSFYGGYGEREEFLTSRVCIARPVGTEAQRKACVGFTGTPITTAEESTGRRQAKPLAKFGEQAGISNVREFATLSRLDYTVADVALRIPQAVNWPLVELPEWPPIPAVGQPPVDWRRQLLFVRDDDPAGVNYFLFRDTVRGGQPTRWQMWTLSDLLGTPAEVAAALAEPARRPGARVVPHRELAGDRFTALGQRGIDVEYFVATPGDTPRHTLRWGMTHQPHRCPWHPKSVLLDNYAEYRDLLHLQLPGDGSYFVALFPRRRGDPAPEFVSAGNGTMICVKSAQGVDYNFLAETARAAQAGEARFRGTAGSVQARKGTTVLALGSAGEVAFCGALLAADSAASIRLRNGDAEIELPPGRTMRTALQLQLPGVAGLAVFEAGAELLQTGSDRWQLTVAPTLRRVTVRYQ